MSKKNKIKLPPLGMRIIKTSLSLLIALVLWDLVFARFFAPDVTASSICVFAMLAVQDTVRGTWRFAFERTLGNVLGIVVGVLFTLLYLWIAGFEVLILSKISFYILMAAGVLLCLYLCKAINKVAVSIITLLVFMNLMFSALSGSPMISVGITILQTFLGILIAIIVNVLIAPPKKDIDSAQSANELGVITRSSSTRALDDVSKINDYDLDEDIRNNQLSLLPKENTETTDTAATAILSVLSVDKAETAEVAINSDNVLDGAAATTLSAAGDVVMSETSIKARKRTRHD